MHIMIDGRIMELPAGATYADAAREMGVSALGVSRQGVTFSLYETVSEGARCIC